MIYIIVFITTLIMVGATLCNLFRVGEKESICKVLVEEQEKKSRTGN